ncbi:MAG: hypothetical protein MI975_20090 [Cytophagales bacterium]|nr:hypothetical protein [Cytophagales bacterium]
MKGYIRALLCFIGIWGFIEFFPELLSAIKPYREVIEFSENAGIDNAALFYSEESLTSSAEQEIKEQLKAGILRKNSSMVATDFLEKPIQRE